jgi:hypothetical protein
LWRKKTEDGKTSRFASDQARVALHVSNYKQPITFCDEYHDDFKSRWYLFDPKLVEAWLAKLEKQKRAGA